MIYGFHVDGSECHSQHCALKHVPFNEGMDTRPSEELTSAVHERLKEIGSRLDGMEREGLITRHNPWEKPPAIKLPPMRWSPEWFATLDPEQQAKVRQEMAAAMARMTPAIQEVTKVIALMAPAFFQAITDAMGPVIRYAESLDERWSQLDEPCDTCAGRGCPECEPIAPNAGSAT